MKTIFISAIALIAVLACLVTVNANETLKNEVEIDSVQPALIQTTESVSWPWIDDKLQEDVSSRVSIDSHVVSSRKASNKAKKHYRALRKKYIQTKRAFEVESITAHKNDPNLKKLENRKKSLRKKFHKARKAYHQAKDAKHAAKAKAIHRITNELVAEAAKKAAARDAKNAERKRKRLEKAAKKELEKEKRAEQLAELTAAEEIKAEKKSSCKTK